MVLGREPLGPRALPGWLQRCRRAGHRLTWNAIGKASGLAVAPGAANRARAFLLNHLISEELPFDGRAISNSDPITGQPAGMTCACASAALRKAEETSRRSPPSRPRTGVLGNAAPRRRLFRRPQA